MADFFSSPGPGSIVRALGYGYVVEIWGTQRCAHVIFRREDDWDTDQITLFESDLRRSAAMLRAAANELDKINLRELPE